MRSAGIIRSSRLCHLLGITRGIALGAGGAGACNAAASPGTTFVAYNYYDWQVRLICLFVCSLVYHSQCIVST